MEQSPESQNEQATNATPPAPSEIKANASASGLPASLGHESLPGALFGYDRDATRDLLGELDALFRELWEELVEADTRITELERERDRRRESEQLISETLILAQQQAQALLKDARRQADAIPEQVELEARAKAKEIIAEAERTRASVLDEAGRVHAFVDETHGQLSDFLLAAVKWCEGARLSLDGESETPGDPASEEPH